MNFADYDRIVFFTGAGISAESGVPTFRGPGGIWKHYDYEEYATQAAFERSPERVWEFHNYRRQVVAACEPNRAHEIIARLAETKEVTVVTQNIDGLHQLAGSTTVLELHGGLWRVRCDFCGNRAEGRESPLEELECPWCLHPWRPDIVWFGDALDIDTIHQAEAALRRCQLLVAIGTSALVYPAAALPLVAKAAGAKCVEVNIEDTPLSHVCAAHRRMKASEALTEMMG